MATVKIEVQVDELACTAVGCEATTVPLVAEVQRVPAAGGFALHARATSAPDGWTYFRAAGRAGDLCPRCTKRVIAALKAAGVFA